jgi:hypothetical protein
MIEAPGEKEAISGTSKKVFLSKISFLVKFFPRNET